MIRRKKAAAMRLIRVYVLVVLPHSFVPLPISSSISSCSRRKSSNYYCNRKSSIWCVHALSNFQEFRKAISLVFMDHHSIMQIYSSNSPYPKRDKGCFLYDTINYYTGLIRPFYGQHIQDPRYQSCHPDSRPCVGSVSNPHFRKFCRNELRSWQDLQYLPYRHGSHLPE